MTKFLIAYISFVVALCLIIGILTILSSNHPSELVPGKPIAMAHI